jgi:glucose/arabinose dehydrogenase
MGVWATDISETIEPDARFSMLARAIAPAGPVEQRKGASPLTMSAPIGEAFEALPQDVLDRPMQDRARRRLADFAKHSPALGGAHDARDLRATPDTMEDGQITVANADQGFALGSGQETATAVESDNAADSEIHAADAILVPRAVAQAPSMGQGRNPRSASAQEPQRRGQAGPTGAGGSGETILRLPDGYRIEKVVDGLNFPTSLAWDDQGRMHVVEAGGALYPEQKEPIRILRVEQGRATPVVDLTDKGVMTAVVGLAWHDGAFYFTLRDAEDLTGTVSRATPDGEVTEVFSGIVDSQSEHQINDIRVGPDGMMYVSVGAAGNAGVVGPSVAPWIMKSPNLHTTPCQDIVLTGRNFQSPNFMTRNDPDDTVLTGAYVPFGTETRPGQRIEGTNKCGGSILVFDPADAEGTIRPYAWGFRNLLGLAWDEETGAMYAAQNGYDIRGSRPVQDEYDPVYRVEEGTWYGVPDFSAALEPLTDPRFEPPEQYQAMVFVDGEPQGKTLGFVIDHEASGLTPPDPSLVVSLHPFNSSPSMIDVAPEVWGDFAGDLFVAEWGDLAPPTNPVRGKNPAGYRVVRVDPETGETMPFVRNAQPGPASAQNAQGQGLDRPFEVEFGPDDALYIVDYGVVVIDMSLKEQQNEPPYREMAGTGAIWKVTRQDADSAERP